MDLIIGWRVSSTAAPVSINILVIYVDFAFTLKLRTGK